ncbi:NAD(+)/NADH kinase [Actinomadura harenae]|uniref:NAD kinase n=1 Tax=Actinomadura harenae TaxID=2483351 RepID=A0A3M2M780_9ACTN|nr:NAD(+)/NADH kinase [Actinomadura harenae]RMI42958.1 NAD(+)/NADH kinase [Actinomadura harenae]
MPIRRIGLVVHRGRAAALDAATSVHAWCEAHGVGCTEIDVWPGEHERRSGRAEAHAAGDPDLVVTLGGDGTFLRGARIAVKIGAGVLGVDAGRVGFLTEVPVSGTGAALDAVHEGRALVEERMTLTLRASRPPQLPSDMEALLCYGRGPALPPPRVRPAGAKAENWGVALDVNALNDVVVEKLARDHQVSAGVYLAGRLLASYSADALAVATPTGSTAYSFAAGGPVLSPHMDAVVFTPIAPHMAFNRSVVAAPDEAVVLRILPHSGRAAVSIDGRLRAVLDPGDWIGVFRAPERVRLIRLEPTDFYGRLRGRFHLADAPATAVDGTLAPVMRPPDEPVPPDLAVLRLPPPDPPGR